ncbi:hypothetical protein L6164_032466 [Bauhinia variegata]|uniref:Uncharacterized protein n=1 Tax=Bauhinia variegata TaxID=167791 RepID=A0ACB9KNT5_BAUVA|nr:hypothetical protein L6164_032466 [Bauhinia variegata]
MPHLRRHRLRTAIVVRAGDRRSNRRSTRSCGRRCRCNGIDRIGTGHWQVPNLPLVKIAVAVTCSADHGRCGSLPAELDEFLAAVDADEAEGGGVIALALLVLHHWLGEPGQGGVADDTGRHGCSKGWRINGKREDGNGE